MSTSKPLQSHYTHRGASLHNYLWAVLLTAENQSLISSHSSCSLPVINEPGSGLLEYPVTVILTLGTAQQDTFLLTFSLFTGNIKANVWKSVVVSNWRRLLHHGLWATGNALLMHYTCFHYQPPALTFVLRHALPQSHVRAHRQKDGGKGFNELWIGASPIKQWDEEKAWYRHPDENMKLGQTVKAEVSYTSF